MTKPISNPKVDAYIAKSAPFAQPVLTHLRSLVHKACPDVVEEMKWSRPFFLHGGTILCNISAFKEHCIFGFWGAEIGKVLRGDGVVQEGGMGSLGRITGVKDLPGDKRLLDYLQQATAFIDNGYGETVMAVSRRVVKAPKDAVKAPVEFATALKKDKVASKGLRRSVQVASGSMSSGLRTPSARRRGIGGLRRRWSGSRRGSTGIGSIRIAERHSLYIVAARCLACSSTSCG